jgi:hypothetical protein
MAPDITKKNEWSETTQASGITVAASFTAIHIQII